MEDQLAASRETIMSLEVENKVIKDKFSRMPSETDNRIVTQGFF